MARPKRTKKTKGKSRYQMMKENRSKMKQKVRDNAKKKKVKGAANYLSLPEDFDSNEDLFYPTKKGSYKFSILPYEVTIDNHPDDIAPGQIWYKRPFLIHRNIGGGNKTVICPRNFDKRCPVCEEASRLWDTAETKEDEDEAREVTAKRRMMMNIFIDGEVKLWEVSEHAFGDQLLYQEINENEECDGFYFLEKEDGYDIKVRFMEGSFKGYKFIEPTKVDFVERKKDLPERLFDEVYDLDTLLECPSYKELKEMFYGEEEDDEDDDDSGDDYDGDDEEDSDGDDSSVDDEDEDEEYEDLEEELNNMKLGELNYYVKENELDLPRITKKNKEEMIEQIIMLMEDDEDEDEDEDEGVDLEEMNKKELLAFCKEEGLKPPLKYKKSETKLREWIEERINDNDDDEDEDDNGNSCPHGHEFGTDCDEYDECEECVKWDECADAQ